MKFEDFENVKKAIKKLIYIGIISLVVWIILCVCVMMGVIHNKFIILTVSTVILVLVPVSYWLFAIFLPILKIKKDVNLLIKRTHSKKKRR